MVQGVRDYLRFIKRGYGRTNHLMALDLRNDRITPEEAVLLIEAHDGKRPASLDVFLEWVGLTESEFMDIAKRHAISPYVHDDSTSSRGDELWDQKLWDRSQPIP